MLDQSNDGGAAAAEGGDGAVTICPVVPSAAAVRSPTTLGAGESVTFEQAQIAATTFTPTAESRRRRLSTTATLPELEDEAVRAPAADLPRRLSLGRALAEDGVAGGEPALGETTVVPAAETDGGDAAVIDQSAAPAGANTAPNGLQLIASGPCAGAAMTPTGVHAMVNQDVAFAAARMLAGQQLVKVTDMFTPSRAKPQPDHEFCVGTVCGTDDILDAVGAPHVLFIVRRELGAVLSWWQSDRAVAWRLIRPISIVLTNVARCRCRGRRRDVHQVPQAARLA